MHLLGLALIGCAAVLSSCAPLHQAREQPEPAVAQGPRPIDDGLPEFDSAEQAFAFLSEEQGLLSYRGFTRGSEHFEVTLPSGEVKSNWFINTAFGRALRPFGEDAYPFLATHLDHEHEFVRVGVHAVLNSAMYSRGIRYNPLDFNPAPQPESARVEAMEAFLAALDEGR